MVACPKRPVRRSVSLRGAASHSAWTCQAKCDRGGARGADGVRRADRTGTNDVGSTALRVWRKSGEEERLSMSAQPGGRSSSEAHAIRSVCGSPVVLRATAVCGPCMRTSRPGDLACAISSGDAAAEADPPVSQPAPTTKLRTSQLKVRRIRNVLSSAKKRLPLMGRPTVSRPGQPSCLYGELRASSKGAGSVRLDAVSAQAVRRRNPQGRDTELRRCRRSRVRPRKPSRGQRRRWA